MTYSPKEGFIFLVVNIQVAKVPPSDQMVLCSGDFVVTDSQVKKYMPISEWAGDWFRFPDGSYMLGLPAVNKDCGQGCLQENSFVSTSDCLWESTVKGQRWQQSYVYVVPTNAGGLRFTFRDLPRIDLGQ